MTNHIKLGLIICCCSRTQITLGNIPCNPIKTQNFTYNNKCILNEHHDNPEYKGGDYSERFVVWNQVSYALIAIDTSSSSVHDGHLPCYFCIGYYNTSLRKFDLQDTLIVDHDKEKTKSLNGIWESKFDSGSSSSSNLDVYDIGSISGKLLFLMRHLQY
jgi:hypothetical protein